MVKMKLKIGYLLFLFLFVSAPLLKAQTAVYDELILQIPSADETRNLPQFKADLIALGGIQYVSYCNQLKCILLKVDRTIHPGNQVVQSFFETRLIPYQIKIGVSITDIITNCKDPDLTIDAK